MLGVTAERAETTALFDAGAVVCRTFRADLGWLTHSCMLGCPAWCPQGVTYNELDIGGNARRQ